MGLDISGQTFLGWIVEDTHYGSCDEEEQCRISDAVVAIKEAIGLYEGDYGAMTEEREGDESFFVGVQIIGDHYFGHFHKDHENIHELIERLSSHAEEYEKAAYEVYELVMGEPADTEPKVLSFGHLG